MNNLCGVSNGISPLGLSVWTTGSSVAQSACVWLASAAPQRSIFRQAPPPRWGSTPQPMHARPVEGGDSRGGPLDHNVLSISSASKPGNREDAS